MRPYNIEIFEQDGTYVLHQNVGDVRNSYDYLAPMTNDVSMAFDERVVEGQYIRIVGNGYDWFGLITGVTVGTTSKKLMTVTYQSFIDRFSVDILFDTNYQGSGTSLEQVIANYINEYFVNSPDVQQRIPNLAVYVRTNTYNWGLHITSDVAGSHYAIINFRDSIITRALEKYRISIEVKPDFVHRRINLYIGVNSADSRTFEADLPNVIEKNVVLKQTANSLNKLTVYNEDDYSTSITYFLHPDGEYDTTDSDRVTPVNFAISSTIALDEQTFEAAAQLVASDRFSGRAYNNLIELKVMNDDDLVRPSEMDIGQQAVVITNGVAYTTCLTGKVVSDTTTLIFGTVRIDLTKILRGETNGN